MVQHNGAKPGPFLSLNWGIFSSQGLVCLFWWLKMSHRSFQSLALGITRRRKVAQQQYADADVPAEALDPGGKVLEHQLAAGRKALPRSALAATAPVVLPG